MARLVGWISRFLTRQRHVWRHKWPVMRWLKHAADIICRQATTESFHSRQTPTSRPTFSCESSPRLPRILRTFSLSHFLYKFITLLKAFSGHLTLTLDVVCTLLTHPYWWYRPPDVQHWVTVPSQWLWHVRGTACRHLCMEQPVVICQECTVADDVSSRAEDCTFPVVVWQWLGDRDCTAQYNCCLPATIQTVSASVFCSFCFCLIL